MVEMSWSMEPCLGYMDRYRQAKMPRPWLLFPLCRYRKGLWFGALSTFQTGPDGSSQHPLGELISLISTNSG